MLTRSKDPADAVGQRVMLVAVEAEYQGKPVHGPARLRLAADRLSGPTTLQPTVGGPRAHSVKPRSSDDDMSGDGIA